MRTWEKIIVGDGWTTTSPSADYIPNAMISDQFNKHLHFLSFISIKVSTNTLTNLHKIINTRRATINKHYFIGKQRSAKKNSTHF